LEAQGLIFTIIIKKLKVLVKSFGTLAFKVLKINYKAFIFIVLNFTYGVVLKKRLSKAGFCFKVPIKS
jgi:hypothetical protein